MYDSKTLKSVQRRATLTKESDHLPYEERLGVARPEDKTWKRRLHTDLQDYARYKVGKLVRWEKVEAIHFISIVGEKLETSWEHTSFSTDRRPHGTILPKNIVLAHSVNSFKRKLDFFLNKISRNTHIYS